jgi:hypothetical protein
MVLVICYSAKMYPVQLTLTFQATLASYFCSEKKKADERLESLCKFVDSGKLDVVTAGAAVLRERLLDAEWREGRALLYCLEALQDGTARPKTKVGGNGEVREDVFESLAATVERSVPSNQLKVVSYMLLLRRAYIRFTVVNPEKQDKKKACLILDMNLSK